MKLLLDTQALIWFASDDRRLSAAARNAVEDSANEVYYSAASIWEVAIKMRLGKLRMGIPLDDSFRALLEKSGFGFLPVEFEHAAHVSTLPMHHGDPFDRLLIAQAIVEGLRPVSNDEAFDDYAVQRVW